MSPTRSPDGRVLPFNEGPFHLAIREQVPILPVVWKAPERLCHATRGCLESPGTSIFGYWKPSPSPGGTSNKFRRYAMRSGRESWTSWIGCAVIEH